MLKTKTIAACKQGSVFISSIFSSSSSPLSGRGFSAELSSSQQLEFPFPPALLPPRILPLVMTHPGDDLGFCLTAVAHFGFRKVLFQSGAAGINPCTQRGTRAEDLKRLREEKEME